MSDEHRARLQAWLEIERLIPRTEFTDRALYKEASAHVSTYDEEDETFEYIGITERAANIVQAYERRHLARLFVAGYSGMFFLFACWIAWIIWIA